jgi:hypothetical protein
MNDSYTSYYGTNFACSTSSSDPLTLTFGGGGGGGLGGNNGSNDNVSKQTGHAGDNAGTGGLGGYGGFPTVILYWNSCLINLTAIDYLTNISTPASNSSGNYNMSNGVIIFTINSTNFYTTANITFQGTGVDTTSQSFTINSIESGGTLNMILIGAGGNGTPGFNYDFEGNASAAGFGGGAGQVQYATFDSTFANTPVYITLGGINKTSIVSTTPP